MACLDTTLLIDLTGRGGRLRQAKAREKLRDLWTAEEPLTTTRFNVAELWVGVTRSRSPDVEQVALERLVEGLIVLEFDATAARIFGGIVGELQMRGRPIGDRDALIASVAICHGQRVVTRNVRHFAEVPGLVVQSY